MCRSIAGKNWWVDAAVNAVERRKAELHLLLLPSFALRPSSTVTFTSPLSLSLSLPDTAFPRINNSAQRNTSRKTLFNLDENENACILQPPVHTTRFSTRAGVTLSMKHRPIITQQTSFHRAIHTSYRIFSPPTYSRSLLPSRQMPSPRFDAFFSASAKSKGRVKGENV